MAHAATLAQAAGQTFDNLQVWWIANQLQPRLFGFWSGIIDTFPEAEPKSRPVSNWLTVLASVTEQLDFPVPIEQLTTTSEIVYRLCWMASFLETIGGISTAQAVALLSAYNGFLGS